MHFGLRNGAFQTEEEPIVEVGGIVKSVLVADDGVGERAELEQALPIGAVACQARDLQSQHDAGVAEGDLADEVLKAVAVVGVFGRVAEILVDRVNTFRRPAERDCSIAQRILTLGALDVLEDLPLCGLSQVNECIPTQMLGGDLRRGLA